MIGQDFPKIEWHILGLDLLEPNAMLGDIILFTTSLILAGKIKKYKSSDSFYQYWQRFFICFGWSFLFGGFGHLLYNYLGLWGKYPAWLLGMLATYYLTNAMISLWHKEHQKEHFRYLTKGLLFLGVGIELGVFMLVDMQIDQSKGLFVPTLVSGIGLIFSLGFLGIHYQKNIDPGFKYLWMAALVLLPNALIQNQKINLHPWFDRNDFSHVLLLFSLLLYFLAIFRTKNALQNN